MPSYEEKIAAGRIPCCVPGCRKTFKPDGSNEIVCGKHWRAIRPYLRRRVSSLRARYRRHFGDNPFWHYPAGSPDRLLAVRISRLFTKAWDKARDEAIERALGI